MGHWERTHRDAAVPDTARRSGGGDDRTDSPRHLPPMHLDLDGDSDTPDEPEAADDARPWRRWLGLGLALLVAAVAGVIATNARHDAVDRTRVELIGGAATASFAGRPDPTTPAWQADFMVFNAGARAVDVVEISVDGWTMPEGAEPADPVLARPGVWTSIRARLTPDCGADQSFLNHDASFVAAGLVRTGGQESTVPLEFAPGPSWFRDLWAMTCAPTDGPYPDVIVSSVEVLPSKAGREHVRTRLHITIPDGSGQATLVRVWSHLSGFGSDAIGLPVGIHSGDAVPVELDWQITNCHAVDQLETAQLSLHLATGGGTSGARLRNASVPDRVLIELGKLSAQVCGL